MMPLYPFDHDTWVWLTENWGWIALVAIGAIWVIGGMIADSRAVSRKPPEDEIEEVPVDEDEDDDAISFVDEVQSIGDMLDAAQDDEEDEEIPQSGENEMIGCDVCRLPANHVFALDWGKDDNLLTDPSEVDTDSGEITGHLCDRCFNTLELDGNTKTLGLFLDAVFRLKMSIALRVAQITGVSLTPPPIYTPAPPSAHPMGGPHIHHPYVRPQQVPWAPTFSPSSQPQPVAPAGISVHCQTCGTDHAPQVAGEQPTDPVTVSSCGHRP